MRKVLFILCNHFTNDTRVLKEARTLTNAGYQVTIFCLWDKHLPKQIIQENIIIKRITYVPQKGASLWRKLSSFLVFINQCIFRAAFRYSIIHCHDLETLPIGLILKFLKFRTKLVYDAHEYETERYHIKKNTKKLFQFIESFSIRYADAVITVSDAIANEYVRLYSIPKPKLVLNCPPYIEIRKHNYFKEKLPIKENAMIFLYQGGLTRHRGIETILQVFELLNDPNKVVVFMGYGPLEEEIRIAAEKYNNIFYHDAVSPDVLLDYTSSADIGLCYIDNFCLSYYYCAPNKFFEYAMAGLPIIISDLYEMKRILEQYQNGWVVPAYTTEALLEIIKNITTNMLQIKRENTLKLRDLYNWEAQEEVLKNLYQTL